MGYINSSGWVMIFLKSKFHFISKFLKKIFGFPYLSLKLSLTLPHKENALNGWVGGVVVCWWWQGGWSKGWCRVSVGLVGGLVLMAEGPPHYSLV